MNIDGAWFRPQALLEYGRIWSYNSGVWVIVSEFIDRLGGWPACVSFLVLNIAT